MLGVDPATIPLLAVDKPLIPTLLLAFILK